MTDTFVVIGGDAEDIPAGTYPGTLSGLSVKHSDKYDNDFRVWTATLDTGSVVEGSSSLNTGAKSKGGRWIAALTGKQPAKGEKVELVGARALFVVIIGDDGWPKIAEIVPQPAQNAPQGAATPEVAPAATEADGGPALDF